MDDSIRAACDELYTGRETAVDLLGVEDSQEAADEINRHYSDHGHVTNLTHQVLDALVEAMGSSQQPWREPICESTVRHIHMALFPFENNSGVYRDRWNSEGRDIRALSFYGISEWLDRILPLSTEGLPKVFEEVNLDIAIWYNAFKRVKPFAYGNKRVAKIVVTALLYMQYGRWYVLDEA